MSEASVKSWIRRTAVVGFVGVLVGVLQPGYAQSAVMPPGSGTEGAPYQISEIGHLVWMGDNVGDSAGKYYSMTADVDASATATWNDAGTGETILEGFRPMGTYSGFRGVFDGHGHTITGLTVNRRGTDYVGLFGYVGPGGIIRNVGMIGGAIRGATRVGGLAGEADGDVLGCYATGAVTGTRDYVGGLVGDMYLGTVSNCYATGAVTGYDCVGGLVGENWGGTVSDCYATGAVSGGAYVGGLIGVSGYYGTVSSCHATGAVTDSHYWVGGLIGMNCHWSWVLDCYATGAVTGSSEVGGLIGRNHDWDDMWGVVWYCYATGAVTGNEYVGGLVGDNGNDNSTVSDCYWDIQTSGQTTSDGGTGKTTAEMKQQATFVGWDFVSVWDIQESVTYPFLRDLSADSDGDGVPDGLDHCPGTVPGAGVDGDGCPAVMAGDFNRDGDVDLDDLDTFQSCYSGPAVPHTGDCGKANFDGDDDVDQTDFGVLQRCFSGAGRPADPACNP